MKFKNIFSLFLAIIISFSFASISYGDETDKELAETTVKEQNAEQRAEEILSSMTLEEKIAQMFMVYMPNKNATKIQKKYQFGGYLLFADNFKNKSYSEKKKQIESYQNASKLNMLIAVDEEGGAINRVSLYKQYRKTPFLSPQKLYSKGKYKKIKSDTREKAKLLLDLGINTNLAPVADTPYKKSDYIYYRTFSTSAKKNSKYVKTVVKEMSKKNLVSTLKHFPGYGNNGDTHSQIIRDKRKLKEFKNRDLLPFKAGIDAGVDMIMVSHNIVNAFDKKYPASLSKKVHKYLRNDMCFDGVIITDGLAMAGVVDFVGGDAGKAAVKSVLAGNDMLCADDYKVQYNAVIEAVKNGKIKESQINKSVKRILIMKLNRNIIE
ncbi:MAG: glycoside hydrolase family 3 N-terminal domain-containing protein [Eubacteriales bacterium]|nr:glycoside hydrolase family 3 N-terminal domain-containing protein [Eubacteriales bacterium]